MRRNSLIQDSRTAEIVSVLSVDPVIITVGRLVAVSGHKAELGQRRPRVWKLGKMLGNSKVKE
jgi:hypothetical protein